MPAWRCPLRIYSKGGGHAPTCLEQFGTLLLTLLQTLGKTVDDSRSLESLLFSLVFQVLQLLS